MASEAPVHENADDNSKVVTVLHVGDTVENIDRSARYYQIRKDDKTGWISDEFVGIGVRPAAIMKETVILEKPDAGTTTERSFLTGDFVVAIQTVGDFVEVRGQGREQETYHKRGNVIGFVPASVLTYDPLDIRFATMRQRALEETNPELADEMMAAIGDPYTWMESQLFIALHSKSETEEEDVAGDEDYEEEDPGLGIMQMELLPPTEGLIAYYKMNHAPVEDASGLNHNGKSFDVGFDHDKMGSAMAAWEFNGTSSYVTIDQWNENRLEPPFTIAAYVKLADITTKLGTIASRGRSADGTGFNFGYNAKDNGERVFFFGMIGAESPINVEVTTEVPEGEWVFLAASYDTKEMKLYVNGVLAGSNIVTRADESAILYNFEDSTEPLEIGRELKSLGRYFHGSIDNLAVWNRALTDDEIAGMNH